MTKFRKEILAAMEEQGLSYAEVAERADVSRAYIYRVLNGTQVPSMDVADRIASALGLVITTSRAK